MNEWAKTEDGNIRKELNKRKNRQEKNMKEGLPVEDPLSVDEIKEWQRLEKIRLQLCKLRDDKKNEKKNIKEKMDAYVLARKKDPHSFHNQIEDYFRTKKLDRGKAFGGKYDGTVAKACMQKPESIYDEGFRSILKRGKKESVLEEEIDDLCEKIIELMKCWNEFFSLLQKEKPTDEERARAPAVASKAVRTHSKLLENITPKVHVAEDHAVQMYLRLRPGLLRLLIEHFVEKQHQDSRKIEDQYKRIPDRVARAKGRAGARQMINNGKIQAKIEEVNTPKRGPYKKRKNAPAENPVTPSPNKRPMANPPAEDRQSTN